MVYTEYNFSLTLKKKFNLILETVKRYSKYFQIPDHVTDNTSHLKSPRHEVIVRFRSQAKRVIIKKLILS